MTLPHETITADQLAREGRALRALAHRLLGSADDAEDVVQDAHAIAIATTASARSLGPWFSGTVRHLAAMFRRGEARRRARERLAARGEVDDASDPAAIAMQAELLRDVAAAVQQLDEPFRTVVVLRFWRGMLPEAIAARLGVPRNTVRSRLQRGLERLRARLDGRHGSRDGWAAPLGALVGVPEAAALAGGGALSLMGWIMQTKFVLGAAAVLVAAVAIPWSLSRQSANAPAPAADPTAAIVAAATPADAAPQRVAVPTPSAAPAADLREGEGPPRGLGSWPVTIQVVTEDLQPVPHAEVTLWTARPSRAPGTGPFTRGWSGHGPTPKEVLRCDERGLASTTLDCEAVYAGARLAGTGTSRDYVIERSEGTAPVQLVLEPVILLQGRVVEADGGASVGALVECRVEGSPGPPFLLGRPCQPAPVLTDLDGTFQLPVQREACYTVRATSGKRSTFPEYRYVVDAHPAALLLTFPGYYGIDGRVVDVDGKPVAAARVTAWRMQPAGADPNDDEERIGVTADADGRFHCDVRRAATYQLLAAAEGQATSELVRTETTAARPHTAVQLRLQRFATIAGQVVRSDGRPLPDLKVLATPETGDPSPRADMPNQEDLFPRVHAATTAADGAFRLQVHPGTKWTLTVRLAADNWRLCVQRRGMAPDSLDVELLVRDEDLAGCVVRGTVHRRDGQPVGDCMVEVVDFNAEGWPVTSSEVDVRFHGAEFTCPPLPRGKPFGVRVRLREKDGTGYRSALAPAAVGPFPTDGAERHFEFWLDGWGRLPVRVLAADGTPVRDVHVYLRRDVGTGEDHGVRIPDAEGRTVIEYCAPGPHHLFVSRNLTTLVEQEVEVTAGDNTELVVHLPTTASPPQHR